MAFLLIHGCHPSPSPTQPMSSSDAPAGTGRLAATVTHVADGDSLYVRFPSGDETELRLIGVDTPETVDPDEPVQCFGPEASDFTHGALTPGTEVELQPGAETRDAYGRLLVYLYFRGRMFNAELVRLGLARPLTIAPNDAHAPLFERLAARAARRGRGLWGACGGL